MRDRNTKKIYHKFITNTNFPIDIVDIEIESDSTIDQTSSKPYLMSTLQWTYPTKTKWPVSANLKNEVSET